MLRKFLRDEDGATAIEYGLIAGFIALAIIAAVGMTGERLIDAVREPHSPTVDAVEHCKERSARPANISARSVPDSHDGRGFRGPSAAK